MKFFRGPVLDNIISRLFEIYEAKNKKQLIVIMDDKPGQNSFIEVEYGNEYLDKKEFSKELATAYLEDIKNSYFRNLSVSEKVIIERRQELKDGYQKTLAVIEEIKKKLNIEKPIDSTTDEN